MKNLQFLIVGVITLTLTSCKEEKPKNIITLIDTSGTIDSNTIEWYRESVENCIMQKMGKKDRFMVLPIDFGSQTASQELYRVDFSKNNYKNEFAGLQSAEVEAQSHANSIKKEINTFRIAFANAKTSRERFNRGTDIIGSVKEASKYFDPNTENILVIFSDMMQYTDKSKMNMESQLNNEDEVETYLSRVEPINLLGFKIIILTGIQEGMTPIKYNAIKSFWEIYINKCEGSLIDYSGGMRTKLEESISNK